MVLQSAIRLSPRFCAKPASFQGSISSHRISLDASSQERYTCIGFRDSSVVERLALGPTGRRFEPCSRSMNVTCCSASIINLLQSKGDHTRLVLSLLQT